MRHLFLLLIFGIIFNQTGFCQFEENEVKPFYISANIGLSLPISSYSKVDNLDGDGYALLGTSTTIQGSMILTDHLGIALNFSFYSYEVNSGFMEISFEALTEYNDVNITSDPYFAKSYMIGPLYFLPINNRFSLHAKLLGGVFEAKIPDFSLNYLNIDSEREYHFIDGADGLKVSFLIGVDLFYQLTKDIAITGGVSYIGAKPSFTNVGFYSVNNFKQRFDMISTVVGIGIKL